MTERGKQSEIDALIEALEIFRKYFDGFSLFHCEHDVLSVMVEPDAVSDEDKAKLDELGFFPCGEFGETFISFRFGSA